MSGSWQQCLDTKTGQPYYWNTASNQVRWDCPPDFSLPPPQLITNISLATPSNPVTSTTSTTCSTVNPTLSSLVSGYDSEDTDDEEGDGDEFEAKDDVPKQTEKEKDEADDILSLIEAEKPPDYAEWKAPLPSSSCKPNSRESKESVQATSMLALASYEDSDEETEPGPETRLDQYGRLVFNPASSQQEGWQTLEQREALMRYRREEENNKNYKQAEMQRAGGERESARRWDNSIPGSRKRRLDLPKGKFNKTENLETDTESEKQSVNFVPFVKSTTVLPGTMESNQTDNGIQKVEESATETEQSAGNSLELVNFKHYWI